ncbi:MAG: SDR family NAD(P)-dependent oxidoreductase [Ilumatobacteraceae bacterium]
MSQLAPLTGRVAIVTGANHGIGAASARRLGTLGADVLITYLRKTNRATGDIPPEYAQARARDGSAGVAAIIEGGRKAIAVEADLTDTDRIPELFDRAETELGPVDIIVNNASGWTADTFLEARVALGIDRSSVTAATIDQVMAVDARAAALMIAEFSRRLIARAGSWGRIIGLTSGGPDGFPTEVSYGAAKAAQENYTMSAATELAPYGVTANVVCPGVTDTGWVNDDVRAFVATSAGHTYVATPEEVANIIGWLCTNDAKLVTGNVIRLR